MTQDNTTNLVPETCCFIEFMTNTEPRHGKYAINILPDAILKEVDDEYVF